ncbi:MAG: DUF3857 domain-containing protein [Bacteroidota bacterium]
MRQISFFIALFLIICQLPLLGQLDQNFLGVANEIVESEGELELLSAEEARYYERKRITILNEDSKANLFYVFYNDENKILDLDADIYDMAGKQIRKVKKSEIRDEAAVGGGTIYSDQRVKYIELNHAQYPYILEFTYTQRIKGIALASMPNWYFQEASSSAVKSSTFTVKARQGLGFQHQLYNIDIKPIISRSGDVTSHKWAVQNIAAYTPEPYSPSFHEKAPILRLTPSQFQIGKLEGSMESWESYGVFINQLWEGRDQLPEELAVQVRELTAGASTNEEKIASLYRYMQENKRYVSVQLGIGGWQPFTANYVEEKGYGDCKALSNYMKAMLREIGIQSYPVIIYSGKSPYKIEDDFVDPAFNHAILYLPEEDMWLECTSRTSPAGYLGSSTADRRVLLVTPEGGQLARTPKLGVEENTKAERLTVQLAADGSAVLDYTADMRGALQERWRWYEFELSTEDLKEEVMDIGKLPSMNLGEVELQSDPDQPQVRLAFQADTKRYASPAGKRLFVPLNLICPRTSVPDLAEGREQPVVLSYGYSQTATIDFLVPEGYRVESTPKPTELDTPFGTYSLMVEETETGIQVQRSLVWNGEEQPAENYESFREFLQQIVKSDGSKMVLVSE